MGYFQILWQINFLRFYFRTASMIFHILISEQTAMDLNGNVSLQKLSCCSYLSFNSKYSTTEN